MPNRADDVREAVRAYLAAVNRDAPPLRGPDADKHDSRHAYALCAQHEAWCRSMPVRSVRHRMTAAVRRACAQWVAERAALRANCPATPADT